MSGNGEPVGNAGGALAALVPLCDRVDGSMTPSSGGDFARLAHELRTPLGAIAMLSEIMRDERLGRLDDARYRAYAADIHDTATHAMSVLSAFVDARFATAGKLPMKFVEFELDGLAATTVSALAPLAAASGVALSLICDGHLPRLIGDRRCVRQILDNLISNALKFTPPGGAIIINVGYALGGPMSLAVTDTGDGMTDAELARARAGATAPEPFRRRSAGSGFGLPLVWALAAASGAGLAIESRLGEGTRVVVTFPHERLVPV